MTLSVRPDWIDEEIYDMLHRGLKPGCVIEGTAVKQVQDNKEVRAMVRLTRNFRLREGTRGD